METRLVDQIFENLAWKVSLRSIPFDRIEIKFVDVIQSPIRLRPEWNLNRDGDEPVFPATLDDLAKLGSPIRVASFEAILPGAGNSRNEGKVMI
jgi:hypothetical protein